MFCNHNSVLTRNDELGKGSQILYGEIQMPKLNKLQSLSYINLELIQTGMWFNWNSGSPKILIYKGFKRLNPESQSGVHITSTLYLDDTLIAVAFGAN